MMASPIEHLKLSNLNKTWILDLDGTLLLHNGHLTGNEAILPGVKYFFDHLNEGDYIVLMTARAETYRRQTEAALRHYQIPYHFLIMGVPHGERIVINDIKPSGLWTAYAINVSRNEGLPEHFIRMKPSQPKNG